MNELKFRDLRADEIECRVGTINEKGLTLLLYKDARCDMKLLDETVGPLNWQRKHMELKGNIYCGVSIWDDTKKQWIEKWDCGTESYTEKEKGESSDSFKRACTNLGIGRELYTSPFIWLNAAQGGVTKDSKGKLTTKKRFVVTDIGVNDKQIIRLIICDAKTNEPVFGYGVTLNAKGKPTQDEPEPLTAAQKKTINELIKTAAKKLEATNKAVTANIEHNIGKPISDMNAKDYAEVCRLVDGWIR